MFGNKKNIQSIFLLAQTAHLDQICGSVYLCLFVLLEKNAFVFQQWYTSTMNLLGTWLTDRMDLQLHLYQLKILIRIVKVIISVIHTVTVIQAVVHWLSFLRPLVVSTNHWGIAPQDLLFLKFLVSVIK